jgi:hypothetical protein
MCGINGHLGRTSKKPTHAQITKFANSLREPRKISFLQANGSKQKDTSLDRKTLLSNKKLAYQSSYKQGLEI